MENCIKYQERVSALIDGVLTEEERLELMEHLAECPDCQAYLNDQTAIHDALNGLEADAPAGFADAVMARVRETEQDTSGRKGIALPHWRRWVATAACCAVAVLGVMGLQGGEVGEGTPDAQQTVSLVTARSQAESAAADSAAAESLQTYSAPTPQGESAPAESAAVPAAGNTLLEDAARTEETKSVGNATLSCTLTTASPLAAQWVEAQLGQSWQAGSSYMLTQAQFDELRGLLDDAGEPYHLNTAENGDFLLLAET